MRRPIFCILLLAGAMLVNPQAGKAQTSAPSQHASSAHSIDVALTYSPEYARVAYHNCACFWLQGVSGDASLDLYHGLGVAASLSDGTASNIQPNVNLSKLTFAAGPRYTWDMAQWKKSRADGYAAQVFVQSLFGVAHGYNSVFPAPGSATSSANSVSIQIGGGLDLALGRRVGLRLAEVEWVRTALPNAAANVQQDLRLGFGVWFRLPSWQKK